MSEPAKILSINTKALPAAADRVLLSEREEKVLDLWAQAFVKHIFTQAYEERHQVPQNQQRETVELFDR